MEKLKTKFVAITLIMLLSLSIIPTNAFAVSRENAEIVKAKNENGEDYYIVYVEGVEDNEFKYATSTGEEALDMNNISLNFKNSVKDDNGNGTNSVAVLNDEANYLYVKETSGINSIIKLDFDNVIDQEKVAEVEGTTNRIATKEVLVSQRNEKIKEVKYEQTIGGLEILEDENSNYKYESIILPAKDYSELMQLVDELNTNYEEKDMYSKIKFAREFSEKYDDLISYADSQTWTTVEDNLILQPEDAQKDDEYVVIIRRTVASSGIVRRLRARAGNTATYDVKFMVSDRNEVLPEKTEVKTTSKRTTKLPITGDSLILFAILAVIVIALIIVYVRMKKLQNKDNK